MHHTKTEASAALADLRNYLSPGDTVHTILRHVSKSGMCRDISLVLLGGDGGRSLDRLAARVLGSRIKNDGVRVTGCGMDMGFALVYDLSSCLFPSGFGCIGEGCPASDHSNGDRDYTPHGAKNGPPMSLGGDTPDDLSHWHRDGGYALRQRWL